MIQITELVKRFVTNFALKRGIALAEGEMKMGVYLSVLRSSIYCGTFIRPSMHFANWEDAVKAAEKMRDNKIARLKKQIKKLEAMTFTNPEEK